MMKKCVSCGAPLTGWLGKIASLAGVKPSLKNSDYCNKCEDKITSETSEIRKTSLPTEQASVSAEPAQTEELVEKPPATDLYDDAEKKNEVEPQ